MTSTQKLALIGKPARVLTDVGPVDCVVEDVKTSYGHDRVLVRVSTHSDPVWVKAERVVVE